MAPPVLSNVNSNPTNPQVLGANAVSTSIKSFPVQTGSSFIQPFDDLQWIAEQEAGELAALSFVEDLIQKCQDIIFEKHIESQVMPFAVEFAQDTMLKVVEWDLYEYDHIDYQLDLFSPDEEPMPSRIDSWARGVVPVRSRPASTFKDLLPRENAWLCIQRPTDSKLSPNMTVKTAKTSSKDSPIITHVYNPLTNALTRAGNDNANTDTSARRSQTKLDSTSNSISNSQQHLEPSSTVLSTPSSIKQPQHHDPSKTIRLKKATKESPFKGKGKTLNAKGSIHYQNTTVQNKMLVLPPITSQQ